PPAALERDHGEAGLRRTTALVLLFLLGAGPGLVLVLDGDDAVADREIVVDGQIHQAPRAFLAHRVVVRGLATNDAADGDIAVEAALEASGIAGLIGELDGAGNLQRARNGDDLVGRAC